MGLIVFGDQAFRDRGKLGVGIQGYSGAQGYTPYDVPTKVGARYFAPADYSKYDDDTDQMIPIAMGNKWDGGKAVYQERVYKAAKKLGKDGTGWSSKQIEDLKPRQVA